MKNILGGFAIAIASYIYLQHGGVVGSFLFSIGLLLILNMGWKLFTGTVGFIKSPKDIPYNLEVLGGNILGAAAILLFPPLREQAGAIVATKLAIPYFYVFIKAIVCGVFIYSAVSCYRRHADYMVVVCVVGFILFGAEHCIADLCYFMAANQASPQTLLFLLIVTIGNSIGAFIIDKIK